MTRETKETIETGVIRVMRVTREISGITVNLKDNGALSACFVCPRSLSALSAYFILTLYLCTLSAYFVRMRCCGIVCLVRDFVHVSSSLRSLFVVNYKS